VLSRFEPQRPGFSQARRWYKRLTGRSVWPRPFQMRFKVRASAHRDHRDRSMVITKIGRS